MSLLLYLPEQQRFDHEPCAPERLPGSECGHQEAHLWPRQGSWSKEPDPPTAALVGSPGGEANSPASRHAKRSLREWSAGKLAPPTSLPPRQDIPHQGSRQPLVLRPDGPSRCAHQGRGVANRAHEKSLPWHRNVQFLGQAARSDCTPPEPYALSCIVTMRRKPNYPNPPVDKPHTRGSRAQRKSEARIWVRGFPAGCLA
jgi:hypothetical protein